MAGSMPVVVIVAAVARNGVIGDGNRLPWHLPADLAHFKGLTLDRPILMGRRTWESLPGLLPRRRHIVISREPAYQARGCELFGSPQEALYALRDAPEVMVVGGASIYRALLPLAARMHLTRVDADVAGDVRFPPWCDACWQEAARDYRAPDPANRFAMTFLTLVRVCPDPR